MNWDQIEIKWAEMTQRVRADVARRSTGPKSGKTPAVADAQPTGEPPAKASAATGQTDVGSVIAQ
jgi:hypothetical protein